MPRFDKTGPEGNGLGTGRGLGTCGSKTQTNDTNDLVTKSTRLGGKGMGRGNGSTHQRGLGNGNGMGRRMGRGQA